MMSARKQDVNSFVEIQGNPITKVGVFPYLGSSISKTLEPDKVYNVYRPREELDNAECIESFKLVPWINDHVMLGKPEDDCTPAEEKGIEGVIGEKVYFEDGYLKGNLKIFSNNLQKVIENGKKELSIGYRCVYDVVSGVWNGIPYDFVQRQIRGNHLATVGQARSGPDIRVLDHFKFTFDSRELEKMDKDVTDQGAVAKTLDELKTQIASIDQRLTAKIAADEEEKKKEVEDSEEDVEEEEVADSKARKASDAMDAQLKSLRSEIESLKKSNVKTVLDEVSRRDSLAEKVSRHVGTFDHSKMTLSEVAKYAVDKLELKGCSAGQEEAMLTGFLAAEKSQVAGVAQDALPVTFDDGIDSYGKIKGVK